MPDPRARSSALRSLKRKRSRAESEGDQRKSPAELLAMLPEAKRRQLEDQARITKEWASGRVGRYVASIPATIRAIHSLSTTTRTSSWERGWLIHKLKSIHPKGEEVGVKELEAHLDILSQQAPEHFATDTTLPPQIPGGAPPKEKVVFRVRVGEGLAPEMLAQLISSRMAQGPEGEFAERRNEATMA